MYTTLDFASGGFRWRGSPRSDQKPEQQEDRSNIFSNTSTSPVVSSLSRALSLVQMTRQSRPQAQHNRWNDVLRCFSKFRDGDDDDDNDEDKKYSTPTTVWLSCNPDMISSNARKKNDDSSGDDQKKRRKLRRKSGSLKNKKTNIVHTKDGRRVRLRSSTRKRLAKLRKKKVKKCSDADQTKKCATKKSKRNKKKLSLQHHQPRACDYASSQPARLKRLQKRSKCGTDICRSCGLLKRHLMRHAESFVLSESRLEYFRSDLVPLARRYFQNLVGVATNKQKAFCSTANPLSLLEQILKNGSAHKMTSMLLGARVAIQVSKNSNNGKQSICGTVIEHNVVQDTMVVLVEERQLLQRADVASDTTMKKDQRGKGHDDGDDASVSGVVVAVLLFAKRLVSSKRITDTCFCRSEKGWERFCCEKAFATTTAADAAAADRRRQPSSLRVALVREYDSATTRFEIPSSPRVNGNTCWVSIPNHLVFGS